MAERGDTQPEQRRQFQPPIPRDEHQVPGSSPDVWMLHEDELTPEKARGLAHMIYHGMFSHPSLIVLSELGARERRKGANFTDALLPGQYTASQFIDVASRNFSTSSGLLKRWVHLASVEAATAVLPHLVKFRGELEKENTPLADLDDLVKHVQQVSQRGVDAKVDDHQAMLNDSRVPFFHLPHLPGDHHHYISDQDDETAG